MPETTNIIPLEVIEHKIYIIRGKKVMLDRNLAVLYEIETRALNQAVRRNLSRFPEDFMFQLNEKEADLLVSQTVIPSKKQLGGYLPYAFTEQGVAMLSSVLNSERAIRVNIQIMRTFTKLREMLMNYKELRDKIEVMESNYDSQFKSIFEAIKLLIQNDAQINKRLGHAEEKQKNKKFGFVPNS